MRIPYFLATLLLLLQWVADLEAQPFTFRRLVYAGMEVREVCRRPDSTYWSIGNGVNAGALAAMDSAAHLTFYKEYDIGQPLIFPQLKLNHLLLLPDGNAISCGQVYNPANSVQDGLLMKLDAAGDPLWAKRIGQAGYNISLFSADLLPGSGMVVSGTATSPPPQALNTFFVAKLDSGGNTLWANTYSGGNNNNFGRQVKATPDRGCVFTGYFEDLQPFLSYTVLIKLDSSGAVQWARRYTPLPGGNFCSGSEMILLPDGYLVYGVGSNGNFLLRTDSAGNPLWTKEYAGTGSAAGQIDFKGNRLVKANGVGYMITTGDGFFWGQAARLDTSGNVIWSSQLYMRLYHALETPNGEWRFTGGGPLFGVTQPSPDVLGFLDTEIGIVQSDSAGQPDHSCMQSSGIQTSASTLFMFSFTPSVLSTGSSSTVGITVSNLLAITADTCVSVFGGFQELHAVSPLEVAPNPGSGQFRISVPNAGHYTVQVFNTAGQALRTLQVSGRDFYLNLSQEPDGLYFCRLIAADRSVYQGRIIKYTK
ncbi:MAG: T9SS type A sorting domain-containing protein [Bacteroidia bacterium]|nr:T9SS type A sorting domain-containing protein [Bacteroidia bacterium]